MRYVLVPKIRLKRVRVVTRIGQGISSRQIDKVGLIESLDSWKSYAAGLLPFAALCELAHNSKHAVANSARQ